MVQRVRRASGWGGLREEGGRQVVLVHDGQALGGAGERHVEGPVALGFLVDDEVGLDHDGGVDLEALDHADLDHGDPVLEAVAGGPAERDVGGGEGVADLVDDRRRHDDRDLAGVDRGALVEGGGHDLGRQPARSGPADRRLGAVLAHRPRRGDVGGGVAQHPGGQLHDGLGQAVAEGELGAAGRALLGQESEDLVPDSWAHCPVAWAMSPTTVIEPLSDRRSSIRSCIGERSCASSTTMWP